METVIAKIRSFAPDSKILLVSPIHLGEKVWEKSYDPEFSRESVDVSKGLADVYAEIARNEHLYFLDASDVAAPSDTDQEHLNEEGTRSSRKQSTRKWMIYSRRLRRFLRRII